MDPKGEHSMDRANSVTPLTEAEQKLVAHLEEHCRRDQVLGELKTYLQVAAEVELATIPIYLYTYYSIVRDGTIGENMSAAQLYANKAGGLIMSVAVEEMLHMSLAGNVLHALGVEPVLYGRAPASYPATLPFHRPTGPKGPDGGSAELIPVAKLGFEQLWHFLQIEYPKTLDATPQDKDWETIGQIYSYIRCLISTCHVHDSDFRNGAAASAIQPYNYSPNNVDTVYPERGFDPWKPAPPAKAAWAEGDKTPGASDVARFADADDSYCGPDALMTVSSKYDALCAIETICDQGEGYANSDGYDDVSKDEKSHYYKFLELQAQLVQYRHNMEVLPYEPRPPEPIEPVLSEADLEAAGVVINFPDNPTSASYPAELRAIADFCSGCFQYMLIMVETIYKVPPQSQRLFFNQGLHRSMIWVLDKYVRTIRGIPVGVGQFMAPTFENIDLGAREDSFGALTSLGEKAIAAANKILAEQPGGPLEGAMKSIVNYVGVAINATSSDGHPMHLPDVGPYWSEAGKPVPAPYPYAEVPAFVRPAKAGPPGMPLHACMGLNGCAGSDRFGAEGANGVPNACAGQGYCATGADHSCYVQNDCRNQGGCGLYGTGEQMESPGHNDCRSLGNCATPINAERFSTNGSNRRKSVWVRARKVFEEQVWPKLQPELVEKKKAGKLPADQPLPEKLGPVPGPFEGTGPTYLWISEDNIARNNMTACGGSGMSGAGGCS
jgi:hypothetical protein